MVQGKTTATWWVFGAAVLLFAVVFLADLPAVARAQATDPGIGAVYDTVPIDIRPDAVRFDWTVERSNSAIGCTAEAWIRPDGAARPIARVYAVGLPGAGEGIEVGQTPLGAIAPGRYLLDVGGSGCVWTINVVAQ